MDKNKFNKFIKNNIDDDFWNNYIELVRQEMIPYQLKALNDEIENAPKSHCIENFKKQAKLYRKSPKVKMLKYTLLINGNIKKVSATIIHF